MANLATNSSMRVTASVQRAAQIRFVPRINARHSSCLGSQALPPFVHRIAKHRQQLITAASAEGTYDLDVDETDLEVQDPFDTVAEHMTSTNLRFALPSQPLSAAASKLDKVTGLAVVDSENTVIGVVSIKDINRLRKQGLVLEDAKVGDYMSKPPIVVTPTTSVAEAAALMLAKKIHRLPVVDENMKFVGITSRTDVFRRLMAPVGEGGTSMSSIDAFSGDFKGAGELKAAFKRSLDEQAQQAEVCQESWVVKYLYDGECSLCRQLMALLSNKDQGRGLINFVNIASLTYAPEENASITYEEAMQTIHVIKRDGTIITGPDALKLLYETVGWGWYSKLASLPLIEKIVEAIYAFVSKYRLPMGSQFDSLLAIKRMNMTNAGVEHCVDDEEACEAEW